MLTTPQLTDFGCALQVNEPHLATMTTLLSMQQARLASTSQSMSLGRGQLHVYGNYFYLNTLTTPLVIPTYYNNRPGHLLRSGDELKLTMPKTLQIKCNFNIRKQGLLLNYPNQISVEGEESYTLKRVPETFIYNTGSFSPIYSPGKISFFCFNIYSVF